MMNNYRCRKIGKSKAVKLTKNNVRDNLIEDREKEVAKLREERDKFKAELEEADKKISK